MKRIDERVHRILDGELDGAEAFRLRRQLAAQEAGDDLSLLEQAICLSRRDEAPLPEGFERQVMARLATRPAPKPSLIKRLVAALDVRALLSAPALASVGALVLAVGLVAGYQAGLRAGRTGSPGAPAMAAAAPSPEPQTEKVLVRFALIAPEAKRVEVAGSFTGWGAQNLKLARASNGAWAGTLELPRGRYEYTFVVDGERWVPDPAATQLVPDGFGGHNALLEL